MRHLIPFFETVQEDFKGISLRHFHIGFIFPPWRRFLEHVSCFYAKLSDWAGLRFTVHTKTHTHTYAHSCNFPIIHRKWFSLHHHSQDATGNVVFPYHLFIFIFTPFFLPCLFVSLMFLFKASKDTPHLLPPLRCPLKAPEQSKWFVNFKRLRAPAWSPLLI